MVKSLRDKVALMEKIATEGYEHDTTRSQPARAFKRILDLIEDIREQDLVDV